MTPVSTSQIGFIRSRHSGIRALKTHCKQNSAVSQMHWQCTISISPSPVFSDCHVGLHAQTQKFTSAVWQAVQNSRFGTEADLQQRLLKSKAKKSTKRKAMHSYLHSKTRTFHWNFFAITPNLDAPHRRCCQNPVSTRHFGNNYRKVANSTHWIKTTTDYTLSPWCSCYHVCLTRIRSAVQVCVVTTLLFSWHLHNGFRDQSQNKNRVIRILMLKENKGDESVQKTMKLSWHLPCNDTCVDESDRSYSEQTFWNDSLEDTL